MNISRAFKTKIKVAKKIKLILYKLHYKTNPPDKFRNQKTLFEQKKKLT